jgi:putative ABC transport system permease protein
MLSKDFLKLIVIAIVISIPLAWYVMSQWLENFAYRMEISGWIFLSAAGTVIGIALLTVSFQSIRAALMNAVDSLRSE